MLLGHCTGNICNLFIPDHPHDHHVLPVPDHDPSLASSTTTVQVLKVFHHQLDQKSLFTPFGVTLRNTKCGSHLPQCRTPDCPCSLQVTGPAQTHCGSPASACPHTGDSLGWAPLPAQPALPAQPLLMQRNCKDCLAHLSAAVAQETQPKAAPGLSQATAPQLGSTAPAPCPNSSTGPWATNPSVPCGSALGTSQSSFEGHQAPLQQLGPLICQLCFASPLNSWHPIPK